MAHAFANIGFETAGASAGLASGWTCVFFATAEEWAAYDVTTPEPWEDFEEEWSGNEAHYWTLPATATASYDTTPAEPREDFEEEWDNEPHYWELASTATAAYDVALTSFEDFEDEWDDNEDGVFEFAGGELTAANYDVGVPEAREDFEEEWKSNEDDITEFTVELVTGTFDGENYEDFEEIDLRMYTAEVTAAGADSDTLTVFVNGVPVTRNCTGVGTPDSERDFLVDAINAAVLGAVAEADGSGKIKLRATNSGDTLAIKVEATGATAKIVLLAPPDKTLYWTQTGELAA